MKNLILEKDVPKLFRDTAYEFAACFYDEKSRTPEFRAHWEHQCRKMREISASSKKLKLTPKDVQVYFAEANWPSFIPAVRDVLAHMLTRSDVPAKDKAEIYDAFLAANEAEGTQVPVIPPTIN